MNVLVIGGTRLMGRHLVRELLAQAHSVTIANRGRSQDDFGDRVKRIVLDRTDEDSIREMLSSLTFDVVFDSLAYGSDDIRHLLDHVTCNRYVVISSIAVYDLHPGTSEQDFDPFSEPVIWCKRGDFPYDETKRQAERALSQAYPEVDYTAVRFPFVIGEDDYTDRLYFYVEHILHQKAMNIDNYEAQMAFVRSDEAGKFLAFFAEHPFHGGINGASAGTISIKEVAQYVEHKTGKRILLSDAGETAPYNSTKEYSVLCEKAREAGFSFTPLQDWIYGLLDRYIRRADSIV